MLTESLDACAEAPTSTEPIWAGLSLMGEDAFRTAAAPLFVAGEVDALEWSFDTGWGARLPIWLEALVTNYGAAGRLFGHGVHYSPLSAPWQDHQTRWLAEFERELRTNPYVHVSEHYGFMTAPPFVRGAPLPAPRGAALLHVGRDRLRRLRERARCPIGLENLALAFSRDEALVHGAFLDSLLDDRDFIVLDLHNLYCQAVNFGIDLHALLASFPLARVAELHVSGGSWLPAWPEAAHEQVRCDTHDGGVPEPVFELLQAALRACPNVRVVILEQLAHALTTESEAARFRADFRRVRAVVKEEAAFVSSARQLGALPPPVSPARALPGPGSHADEAELAAFQSALLCLLVQGLPFAQLQTELRSDPAFEPFRSELGETDPRALGIASRVVQKWARRRH